MVKLSVTGLQVDYGAVTVLRDLQFVQMPGSFSALLGPNGTGKTSMLKGIAGLVRAKGAVCLGRGDNLTQQQRANAITYMPQDTGFTSSLTVIEVILLGRLRSLGLQVPQSLQMEARTMLAGFGLEALETRTLDEISGGQRQLVYLAQCLFRNPQVLLLDEPTAALDLRHQLIVLDRIVNHCRENRTIAIAAMHDLSLAAKSADRLICMSQGKIVADGSPSSVLSAALIRDLYGERVYAAIELIGTGATYLDNEALKAFCRGKITDYKIPGEFTLHTALPRLANGKLDRRAIGQNMSRS